METLRAELYAIVRDAQPCTVRHVYYLGLGRLWEKDTGKSRRNYSVPVRELGYLREHGLLPWEWITDGTRLFRREMQYDSILEALERTAETYRRHLWASQPRRVEVWCESDSISGVLHPVTTKWGVGLYSCRGQSSKTFIKFSGRRNDRIGCDQLLCVADMSATIQIQRTCGHVSGQRHPESMDQMPDLPRPRQRGDQLSLYASTASEEAEGVAASLKVAAPREPRSVAGWWDDLVEFESELPRLEGDVFAAALRLTKGLQQAYPGLDVRLRMGPRAAWRARGTEQQAEWEAMKRPRLPPRVEDLIKQLSPECSICGTTALELTIAHIVDWSGTRRLVEAEPLRKDMPLRATLMFHDPWNMLRLCRDYVRRSGCHDRQEQGEITEQEVRAARAALDLRPGADRAYGAFLDQGLHVGSRKLPIDMNAIGAALTHLIAPAQQANRESYLLRQGLIAVDRAQGSIRWGEPRLPRTVRGRRARALR